MRLALFKSPPKALCTCPSKYSLNTYTGRCGHNCVYCYAPKFPSFTGPTRPRISLLETIDQMVEGSQKWLPVMISDCTDPYQPLEAELRLTRRCIQALARRRFPILVTTKSDLVVRDIDLLSQTPSVVAMTVTTINHQTSRLIEPNAPAPESRISALKKLARNGITTVARVDPIIPYVNDDWDVFEELVELLGNAEVRQVTVSTMKPIRGFYEQVRSTKPCLEAQIRSEYARGKAILGYQYLPSEMRAGIVQNARRIVLAQGLKFASCREGLSELNTAICDGSSYLRSEN
jgi:DNA repair photolyase